MKKLKLILFLTLISLLISAPVFADSKPEIVGESGILIDYTTGQILYEKNAYETYYPSSTTKILTALIILENHSLDEVVTVDAESPFVDGSKIFIFEDEKLTVEQLLSAMLIASANDCAEALAVYHSGSIEMFAQEMNERAKELGALDSNFVNPHGLHDNNHYTTAYDFSLITREAYANPIFQAIVATSNYVIPPTEYQVETRYMKTTNHFLYDTKLMYYEGHYIPIKYDIVDGIKTGYTTVSKNNLVSTAKKNGNRLISVVFKSDSSNIYIDSRKLFDYGFDSFKYHNFTFSGNKITSIPIKNGTLNAADLYAEETISGMIPIDYDLGDIQEEIELIEPQFPILENQSLGKITYRVNGVVIGESNLITDQDIFEKTLSMTAMNMIVRKDGLGKLDYKYYVNIILNLLISFIVWRIIMTSYRLYRRNKKRKKYQQ